MLTMDQLETYLTDFEWNPDRIELFDTADKAAFVNRLLDDGLNVQPTSQDARLPAILKAFNGAKLYEHPGSQKDVVQAVIQLAKSCVDLPPWQPQGPWLLVNVKDGRADGGFSTEAEAVAYVAARAFKADDYRIVAPVV